MEEWSLEMFQICSIYHEKCRDFEKTQPWPRQLHTFLGFLGVMIHPHQVLSQLDLSNHQTIGFIGKSIGLRIAEASWVVFGFGMGWQFGFSKLKEKTWVSRSGSPGVYCKIMYQLLSIYQITRFKKLGRGAPPQLPRGGVSSGWFSPGRFSTQGEPKSWRPRPVPCSNSAWPSGSAWDVSSRSRIPILILHLDPAGG